MIKLRNLGKIAVLGLGITGRSVVGSLMESGAKVVAWDDNPRIMLKCKQEFGARAAEFRRPYDSEWGEFSFIVVAPGIPTDFPAPHPDIIKAREAKIEITSDVELLQQGCPEAFYVGITGTNGKSTTTSLIGHILKHANKRAEIGGNIGKPALSLEPLGCGGNYVLELSSFQLELLKKTKFDIGVILNITPDHLNRYKDFTAYVNAKAMIAQNMNYNSYLVVSYDYEPTREIAKESSAHTNIIPISTQMILEKGISVVEGKLYDGISGQEYTLQDYHSLRGRHNAENIAASFAVATLLKIAPQEALKSLESFVGLPHRMQRIKVLPRGLVFINDSKATNSDSAAKALDTFDDIYWVLGGVSKDGGIECLKEYFPKIRKAYIIGEASAKFAATLSKHGVPHIECGTLELALSRLRADNPNKGVVLLSPACASLDQWSGYEERGEAFMSVVSRLWQKDSLI